MLMTLGQSDVHTTHTSEVLFALALVCSLELNDHLQLEYTFHVHLKTSLTLRPLCDGKREDKAGKTGNCLQKHMYNLI